MSRYIARSLMRPPRECHDNSYFFSSGEVYEKARFLLAKLGLGCGITTSRLGVAASHPSSCKPQWADHLSLTGAVRLVLTLGCALQHGAKMWRVGSHVCYEEGAPVRVFSRPAINHQCCSCLLPFIVLELIPWDFHLWRLPYEQKDFVNHACICRCWCGARFE